MHVNLTESRPFLNRISLPASRYRNSPRLVTIDPTAAGLSAFFCSPFCTSMLMRPTSSASGKFSTAIAYSRSAHCFRSSGAELLLRL